MAKTNEDRVERTIRHYPTMPTTQVAQHVGCSALIVKRVRQDMERRGVRPFATKGNIVEDMLRVGQWSVEEIAARANVTKAFVYIVRRDPKRRIIVGDHPRLALGSRKRWPSGAARLQRAA